MTDSFDYAGLVIRIEQDEDAQSPREDVDNFGTMVCFSHRYSLGDEHDYRSSDYSDWEAMEEAIVQQEDPAVILSLYLYDHSGITISTSSFNCPWDGGQIGFTFVSKADVRKEYGLKRISKKALIRAMNLLDAEVKAYDTYLTGDVWNYIIERKGGEEISSCCGLFGHDYCVKEAKAVVDRIWAREAQSVSIPIRVG